MLAFLYQQISWTYKQIHCVLASIGFYRYVRRFAIDLELHFRSNKVNISLKTKSAGAASRFTKSTSQRQDDYWRGLRRQRRGVPALHLVINDDTDVSDKSPTVMDAVEANLRLRAEK